MRILIALLIIWIVIISGCVQEQKMRETEPYKFGAALQLSGPQAFYGNLVKYGIELATEDINSAGGINGRPVVALFEDTASDRAQAAEAAQKLIQVNRIDALFTITPWVAGVVAPIAEENKVPYIYIGSVNVFALNKTYVFKDYPSPQDLCEILTKKALEEGHRKIALFGTNDEVTLFCREGAERLSDLDVFETYNYGDKDFRTQFTKIKDSGASALILYAQVADCPTTFKQIKELGISVQLLLPVQSFACGSADNTAANVDVLEGSYGSDIALDENRRDTAFVSFRKRLEEKGWLLNIRGSALAYDVVHEMAKAYSGCNNSLCAVNNIRSLQMQGLTGNISYNGTQIVKRQVMLTKFVNGTWGE